MSEEEITATIAAIAYRLETDNAVPQEERQHYDTLLACDRAALYGALDALEVELKRVRARRPA
jgi:hypothetical protein